MPRRLPDVVGANLLSVSVAEGPAPDPANAHLVDRVAAASPAGSAGVEEGDLLVTFQDKPASAVSPEIDRTQDPKRRYGFWSAKRRKHIRIEATGIAVGVELERTVQNVLRDFESRPSPYDLEIVWRAQDWKSLEELSRFFLTGSRQPPGLFKRVLSSPDEGRRATPALLFLGAALIEQEKADEGMPLVEEYLEKYAASWTLNFMGVAQLYAGLACLAAEENEQGLGRIFYAWENTEAPYVAELIEKLTGEAPAAPGSDEESWVGKKFPVDYSFEPIPGGGKRAALATSLKALTDGRLLAVCLLGPYRINGPYNDFMMRYRNYGRYFSDYLQELHVVTENPQTVPENYAHFLAGENGVRSDGLALSVVLDRGGTLTKKLEPDAFPCVMLLDAEGLVHYQGMLNTVEMWDVLASRYA